MKLAQKIEEALILIRLDCWDDRKKLHWPICKRTGERINPRLVALAKARLDAASRQPNKKPPKSG